MSKFSYVSKCGRCPYKCYFNREDFIPCLYQNKQLKAAGPKYINQTVEFACVLSLLLFMCSDYSVHFIKIRPKSDNSQETICNVRPKNQNVSTIPDLGTKEMRVLFSPGFEKEEQ